MYCCANWKLPDPACSTKLDSLDPRLAPKDHLCWCRAYVQSWASRGLPEALKPESRSFLLGLFEQHVDMGLNFVRLEGQEHITSVDMGLVTSLAHLLQVGAVEMCTICCCQYTCSACGSHCWPSACWLQDCTPKGHPSTAGFPVPCENPWHMQALLKPERGINYGRTAEQLEPVLLKVFAFAYIWALGGNLAHTCHDAFDSHVRQVPGSNTALRGSHLAFRIALHCIVRNMRAAACT